MSKIINIITLTGWVESSCLYTCTIISIDNDILANTCMLLLHNAEDIGLSSQDILNFSIYRFYNLFYLLLRLLFMYVNKNIKL